MAQEQMGKKAFLRLPCQFLWRKPCSQDIYHTFPHQIYFWSIFVTNHSFPMTNETLITWNLVGTESRDSDQVRIRALLFEALAQHKPCFHSDRYCDQLDRMLSQGWGGRKERDLLLFSSSHYVKPANVCYARKVLSHLSLMEDKVFLLLTFLCKRSSGLIKVL